MASLPSTASLFDHLAYYPEEQYFDPFFDLSSALALNIPDTSSSSSSLHTLRAPSPFSSSSSSTSSNSSYTSRLPTTSNCLIANVPKAILENYLFPYVNVQDLAFFTRTNRALYKHVRAYANNPRLLSNQVSTGIAKLGWQTVGPLPTHPILLRQWVKRITISQRVIAQITQQDKENNVSPNKIRIRQITCAECGNKSSIQRKLSELRDNIILCVPCEKNVICYLEDLTFAWGFTKSEVVGDPSTLTKIKNDIDELKITLYDPDIDKNELTEKLKEQELLLNLARYRVFGCQYQPLSSSQKNLVWFTSDLINYRLNTPLNPKRTIIVYSDSEKRKRTSKKVQDIKGFDGIKHRIKLLPIEFQRYIKIDETDGQETINWRGIPEITIDTIFSGIDIDALRKKSELPDTAPLAPVKKRAKKGE